VTLGLDWIFLYPFTFLISFFFNPALTAIGFFFLHFFFDFREVHEVWPLRRAIFLDSLYKFCLHA